MSKQLKERYSEAKLIPEAIKMHGHTYDAIQIAGGDRIYVGKEGVLGDKGIHISWKELDSLERKYKG